MTILLAAAASPASDLLDVFESYDGAALFGGLAAGAGGPGILGRIGWIFTGFGAFFLLWGFVLRSRGAGGGDKVDEIVRTWMIIGFMMAGPFLMRTAMDAADGIYESSVGGPLKMAFACVKAAYAMPDATVQFDALARRAQAGAPASAQPGAQPVGPAGGPDAGGALGYLKAYATIVWKTALGNVGWAAGPVTGFMRTLTLLSGFGSAMMKCMLIAGIVFQLYVLLLGAGALLWFMCQARFFLAVVGTMMLPLFLGLLSLPAGHPNRQAAQAYIMHMVSLALWPVAWAIGQTGTIAFYDALISLIAGTSRVPDFLTALQWDAITSGAPIGSDQVRAMEAALGNWFMGNTTALLGILIGGIGFAAWVFIVSVFGPVFLHRLLTTGAEFMTQALAATGRSAAEAGRIGAGAGYKAWTAKGGTPLPPVKPEGALPGSLSNTAFPLASDGPGPSGGTGRTTLRDAARRIGRG